MYLAVIFLVLDHFKDFEILGYGGHFVFQNEAKILRRHVFIAINIPFKFGEDIFINERDVKVYEQTHGWMHTRKTFYNLPTTSFAFHHLFLHSEAKAPIVREK